MGSIDDCVRLVHYIAALLEFNGHCIIPSKLPRLILDEPARHKHYSRKVYITCSMVFLFSFLLHSKLLHADSRKQCHTAFP